MHQLDCLKRVLKNAVGNFYERHWFREHSLYRHMALEAHRNSVAFANQHLTGARRFSNRRDMLLWCAKEAEQNAEGDALFAEFGVYKAESLRILCAALPDRIFYGFDSFEGLPEDWGAVLSREFFKTDALPEVPSNALLVKGWFKDTLPGFMAENAGSFAFVHIDCDLYSSTRDALEYIAPRLRPGSVIIFDEFLNVVGWQEHEYKAWQECVANHGLRFSYIAFNSEQTLGAGSEVAIRIEA